MASIERRDDVRKGSCLCGKITYSVTGKSFTAAVCHCSNCKKVTGSIFATNAMYKKEQLEITSGKDEIQYYLDTKVDSGNTMKRCFCRTCGSSLFIENTTNKKMADVVILMMGSLDGADEGFRPKLEFYENRRYDFVSIQKGSGKYV